MSQGVLGNIETLRKVHDATHERSAKQPLEELSFIIPKVDSLKLDQARRLNQSRANSVGIVVPLIIDCLARTGLLAIDIPLHVYLAIKALIDGCSENIDSVG